MKIYIGKDGMGLLLALGILVSACEKRDVYKPPKKVTIDDYFDFATVKNTRLSVDYQVEGKTFFEVYGENPLELNSDGQIVKKEGLSVLASGFTDENGKYGMKASLPASVGDVYIYSPSWGVPLLYKTSMNADRIDAVITDESAVDLTEWANTKTRAAGKRGGEKIMDKFEHKLCDWNPQGRPHDLSNSDKIIVDKVMRSYFSAYLPENGGNGVYKPYVTEDADIELYEEASEVVFCYLGGATTAQSAVGYYCYKAGASLEEIREAAKHACVIFPNAHSKALGKNPLQQGGGHTVAIKLKYIDEEGRLTDENFPQGTKIGFMLWNDGWLGGHPEQTLGDVFYSTEALNTKIDISCMAALQVKDKKENVYNVLAFEDWPVDGNLDYNDVVFAITSNPAEAIVVPPAPDPEPQLTTETYEGLLCFEDNWPLQGDYDMNDVVVKYRSNVTFNDNNELVALVNNYTLIWAGADYSNGFGFELPFDLSGQKITATSGVVTEGNVVTLFSDARKELGVENVAANKMPGLEISPKTYTVSVDFKTPVSKDGILPPYNPFISIAQSKTEVHLVNYTPTPNADNIFPQGADISDGNRTFFISAYNFPFAIHLDARMDPRVLNLNYKAEASRIDAVYEDFSKWADSKGKDYSDWYLRPKKSL